MAKAAATEHGATLHQGIEAAPTLLDSEAWAVYGDYCEEQGRQEDADRWHLQAKLSRPILRHIKDGTGMIGGKRFTVLSEQEGKLCMSISLRWSKSSLMVRVRLEYEFPPRKTKTLVEKRGRKFDRCEDVRIKSHAARIFRDRSGLLAGLELTRAGKEKVREAEAHLHQKMREVSQAWAKLREDWYEPGEKLREYSLQIAQSSEIISAPTGQPSTPGFASVQRNCQIREAHRARQGE